VIAKKMLVMSTLLLAGLAQDGAAQVGKNNSGIIEPNVATKEQLLALPGADAALADAIIKGRPYADMVALDKIVGATLSGEKKTALYRKLFLPINLNTATRAEILLVPGVAARMAHEFEEYRPYDGLPRFRREIGKYVDAAQVATFEQFVFVPIDLNTASDADILSIPGLGSRMLREFKEYRPYRNLEQFRREIGKYVDKNEVARLERYVTIK
jgi:DNA uptake protein ComE-like DNA-binding protein